MRRWLLPLMGLLTGCLPMSVPTPQIREYQLTYPPPAAVGDPVPAIVEVGPIAVAALYDRDSIVYRDGAHGTGTYVDSRWSTNPRNMVADLLVRDLSATGAYRAVQRAPALLVGDYRLTGELVEIDERASAGGCRAHLELRLLLARTRGVGANAVLWQRTYDGDEPAACNQPSRLAAAMSQALAGVSARVQRDVYETIATATRARAALPP